MKIIAFLEITGREAFLGQVCTKIQLFVKIWFHRWVVKDSFQIIKNALM